jgi:hypothetical protein
MLPQHWMSLQERVADHMSGSNFNELMVLQQHLPYVWMKDLV